MFRGIAEKTTEGIFIPFEKVDPWLKKYQTDKVQIMKDNVLIVTHQEIANDIHTSRVVVSRLLKQLKTKAK